MANWDVLKSAIAGIIKTNGNQEITGQLLQNVLNNIVSSVGENATFAGIATPTTNPGAPDGPVFYLATEASTYANFNGITILEGEAVILQWNNGVWSKKTSGFATQQQLTELESKNFSVNASNVQIRLNSGESVSVNKDSVNVIKDYYIGRDGKLVYSPLYGFSCAEIYTNSVESISFETLTTATVAEVICFDINGNVISRFNGPGTYGILTETTKIGLNFFGETYAENYVLTPKKTTSDIVFNALYGASPSFSLKGYYDTKGEFKSRDAFRATELLCVGAGCVVRYKVSGHGAAVLACYDKNKEFLSGESIIAPDSSAISGEKLINEDVYYVALCNYNFSVVEAPQVSIEVPPLTHISNISSENNPRDRKISDSYFSLTGYIKVDGSFTAMNNVHSTDFVNVQGYNQIEVFAKIYDAGHCAFYFADKTLCSTFQNELDKKIVDIPNGAVYVRLCNFDADVAAPKAILRKVSNHWQNRKIAIYGTSIEAGYPLSSFENNRERVNTYSFMSAAIEQIGAIPLNYAVPSGFICKKAGSPKSFLGSTALDIDYGGMGIQNVNIHNRLLNYIGTAQDADAYLFAYHVNDTLEDNALLDDSEVDYGSLNESTFVGAYNYTLKEIFTAKPNAVVMIASHYSNDGFSNQEPRRYKRVNAILKGIADYWNIPFVDLASSGIIINNGMINNYTAYMTDAGHPAAYNKAEGLTLITRITERVKAALLSI